MILDTNASSSWSDGTPAINSALRNAARLVVPSIVLGEYYFGIHQSRYCNHYESWLNRNLPAVEIITRFTEILNDENQKKDPFTAKLMQLIQRSE